VFHVARLIHFPLTPRARQTRGWRPQRRHSWRTRVARRIVLASALASIAITAAIAWALAGGDASGVAAFLPAWLAFAGPPPADLVVGGALVHLDSTPAGAEVRVDSVRRGRTPVALSLAPGRHTVSLLSPETLDATQTLDVPAAGVDLTVSLWRRRPDILPVRPVYPGADLVDAQFLADGQVALTISLPGRNGPSEPASGRELWRLDPATGSLVRLTVADGSYLRAPLLALAPDGQRVAYLAPGSSAGPTTLWPTKADRPASENGGRSPSVRLAALTGSTPPQPMFELPSAAASASARVEHLVDLVWTPDSSRLVAITQTDGTPTRTRFFLIDIGRVPPADASRPPATELVLLPAEEVPASTSVDPTGRWLAFVAHARTASGGPDILTLCVIELRPGGDFRDLADLGPAQRIPAAAPVAWGPSVTGASSARLAFVAPTPGSTSNSGGLLDLFGALRPSAPPSGLFLADLATTGLAASQPHRLGTATNMLAPVWRDDGTILGLVRQDNGALALRTVDPGSGGSHDPGAQLPAGTGQGSGLAAHWDAQQRRALLLSRPSAGATTPAGTAPLQAWLVSFVPAAPVAP